MSKIIATVTRRRRLSPSASAAKRLTKPMSKLPAQTWANGKVRLYINNPTLAINNIVEKMSARWRRLFSNCCAATEGSGGVGDG